MKTARYTILLLSTILSVSTNIQAQNSPDNLRKQAYETMFNATRFFTQNVAYNGGYVYFYSPDMKQRWGEGVASETQIWVQPPGTPTVGMAYLKAYHATGDSTYLLAAQKAAEALIYGQLSSGGWTNSIDFNPKGKTALYRNGKGRGKNNSSLDDGQTQSAIKFLIQMDKALDFKNETIHEAVTFALNALLKAQFPNGAFPQVWKEPVSSQPILSAQYPVYDWRTEGRIKNYWDMYTLNDNVCGYVADTLIEAYETYGDETYLTALKKLGDFLILAQMPAPQSGWAQQYNYSMQPIWARKFEPAAIASDETQEAISTLITIYRQTHDKTYLKPIPSALNYLKKSVLPGGQLARYYELRTNRPLYMTRHGKAYELTYDDSNLPSHYGWKIATRINKLHKEYTLLLSGKEGPDHSKSLTSQQKQVIAIIKSIDNQGRWINTYQGEGLVGQPKFKPGQTYISSQVFSRNLELISEYLMRTKNQ